MERHALERDPVHQAPLVLAVADRTVLGRTLVAERDRVRLPREARRPGRARTSCPLSRHLSDLNPIEQACVKRDRAGLMLQAHLAGISDQALVPGSWTLCPVDRAPRSETITAAPANRISIARLLSTASTTGRPSNSHPA